MLFRQENMKSKNVAESSYSRIRSEIAEMVAKALAKSEYGAVDLENSIELSKGFGDISCSIAFRLSKEHKKDPNSIANEIKSKISKSKYISKVSVENGFINFHLDRHEFTALVLAEQKAAPKASEGKKERVIVEYVSVNPNKPWHIGHLRNALLGDSISNIHAAQGYDVERENYIDDLGLQMAESTWWFMNRNDRPDKKFDHWLGEEYVKVNTVMDDKAVKEGIANVLSLMGQDGTNESIMARDIARGCLIAQNATAYSFSIYQDLLVWESDIVREKLLEKALTILKNHGFIDRPKSGDYIGCMVINLKKLEGLPEGFKGLKEDMKVLMRSNGAPTYLAKDIAFHMWKLGIIENTFKYSVFEEEHERIGELYTTGQEGEHKDFANAKMAINIIDARQSHLQSIIGLVFKAAGKDHEAERIRHLAYGEVELESGAISGRKGTWLGYSADDLLRETQQKAGGMISKRFRLSGEEHQKIAKSVAVSAIKFEFLRPSPEKKIIFSWERALNFEGNSGPYAQYMHARASRILEGLPARAKAAGELPEISETEFGLVKLLSKRAHVMEKAAKELRPNVITEYINELSRSFATFYESSPILKAESENEKAFRIMLTRRFKETMRQMLELLGISALDRM